MARNFTNIWSAALFSKYYWYERLLFEILKNIMNKKTLSMYPKYYQIMTKCRKRQNGVVFVNH